MSILAASWVSKLQVPSLITWEYYFLHKAVVKYIISAQQMVI